MAKISDVLVAVAKVSGGAWPMAKASVAKVFVAKTSVHPPSPPPALMIAYLKHFQCILSELMVLLWC